MKISPRRYTEVRLLHGGMYDPYLVKRQSQRLAVVDKANRLQERPATQGLTLVHISATRERYLWDT
jgi:hypothetical protein